MSEITVASTTDTQEAVQQAAGLEPEAGQQDAVAEESHNQSENPNQDEDTVEDGGATSASRAESETAEEEANLQSKADKPQPNRKGRVQKRIDTLTRRLYEQQEELDALRDRVSKPQTDSSAQQRPRSDAKKPAIGDFPSYEQYIEALADWRAGQRFQEQRQAELVQAEQERTREVFETYNDAAQAARVKYEDFEEVVGRKDLKIPQAAQAAVIEAGPLGPDIAYYLGKHPELCYELAEMSPMRAVATIGQIEAQLQKPGARSQKSEERQQPVPRSRTITSAPAPISPVTGSSRKTMTPMDELPYRDYKRLRDQEERREIR